MTDPAGEKRTDPRAAIELNVAYKKVNAFFSDYTRNISQGGTFIGTPSPLPIGTVFLFQMKVPYMADALRLTGVVRWIVEQADAGKDPDRPDPGMGIEFQYANDDERKAVHGLVEDLMREQLGEMAYQNIIEGDD